MNEPNITPQQMDALLKYASQRLGTTPEQLSKTVQAGRLDSLTKNMPADTAAKVQAMAKDKKKAEQLLSSPEAQQLIQQLLKNNRKTDR